MSDDELYGDIDELIRVTDDAKDRAMILIMQRILLRVEKALADETALQAKVLNGLVPYHKDDHTLIYQLREVNVLEAVLWINEFRASNVKEVCEYARTKMNNEKDDVKTFRRKMNEALFDIAKGAVLVVLGAAGYAWIAGFPLLQQAATKAVGG